MFARLPISRRLFATLPFFSMMAALCSFALLTSCASSGSSRTAASPEKWLPENAAAVVSIPNAQAFRERWKRTATGQAWSDPAVHYWRTRQFDPVLADLFKKWNIGDLIPLLDLATGQVIAALEAPADAETPPAAGRWALYAAFDFGPNAEKAKSLMEKSWEGDALPSRDPKIPEIVRYGQEGRGRGSLYVCWVGDTCFLGTSREGLKTAVARCLGLSSDLSDRSDKSDKPPKGDPLAKSPQWRKTAALRNQRADAWMFVDAARLYDLAIAATGEVSRRVNNPRLAEIAKTYGEWTGFDALDAVCSNLEIRPPGFYQRTAVTTRKAATGILFSPEHSPPLRTPDWITRGLDGYSVGRMQSPLALKQSTVNFIHEVAPFLDGKVAELESTAKSYLGMELDELLGALGTEVASLSRTAKPVPDVTILWEARNPAIPAQAVESIVRSAGGTTERRSFMGYRYQSHTIPPLPFPICTAELDGFFVIGLQNRWFQGYLTARNELSGSDSRIEPEAPMGPESLLPDLEAPFEKVPKNMTVTARSFGNIGPMLEEINKSLPLAFLMLNMQLKQQGLPKIPKWVNSCIPPLGPFGQKMFPSVGRTMQREGLILSESYSPLDPVASPFLASALAIGARYYQEQQKKLTRGKP